MFIRGLYKRILAFALCAAFALAALPLEARAASNIETIYGQAGETLGKLTATGDDYEAGIGGGKLGAGIGTGGSSTLAGTEIDPFQPEPEQETVDGLPVSGTRKPAPDRPPPIVAVLYDVQKSGDTFTFKTIIANFHTHVNMRGGYGVTQPMTVYSDGRVMRA